MWENQSCRVNRVNRTFWLHSLLKMDEGRLFPEIRKLRKKLRQIENLQNAQRPLTSDEQIKIRSKKELRQTLQEKLKQYKNISATEDLGKNRLERETVNTGQKGPEELLAQEPVENLNQKESEEKEDHLIQSPPKKDLLPKKKITGTLTVEQQIEKYKNSEVKPSEEHEATLEMHKPASGCREFHQSKTLGGAGDRRKKDNETTQDKVKKKRPSRTEESSGEVNPWDKVKFSVLDLTGHNDIICSIDCSKDSIVSGSRDTSIKVWDASTGEEIRSLGGHTDSVTSVELLPLEECDTIAKAYGQQGETGLILSCSLDCCIKLWALKSGHLLKSIYTFNGIISMSYIRGRRLTVTGYTGGKIELWDILSGESIFSIIGHGEAVTALMVSEDKITTASADGMIKVWELRETKLHPIFVSENVKPELPRMKLISRKIHTVVEKENVIYYGDNGLNVKVLDWRRGVVHKIRNHKEDNAYGFVDSIHVTSPSSYLICSGYDLDLGNGYLNIFSLEQEKYLATLMDDDVSRIFTMATSTTHEGGTRLVTGGAELKVWDVLPSNHRTKDKVVAAFYNQAFSRRVFDSEDESADEDSTDGEEEDNDERQPRWSGGDLEHSEEASGSWCSIS